MYRLGFWSGLFLWSRGVGTLIFDEYWADIGGEGVVES
jgi:hypothetical protein